MPKNINSLSQLIQGITSLDKRLPTNSFVFPRMFETVLVSEKRKPPCNGSVRAVNGLNDVLNELRTQDGKGFPTLQNYLIPFSPI